MAAFLTSNQAGSVRIRVRAPVLVLVNIRDCPEIGADSVWSGEDAGASPVSLTMPVYANRQSGLP